MIIKLYKVFIIIPIVIIVFSCKSIDTKSKNNPPNFIIILADDQGWNGTSVQMSNNEPFSKSDYHYTPNLEKLAARGMRFSSAYASAPVCAPSRYAIQLGQTPARLRMIRVNMNTRHINHETPITIPKLLKNINSNYATAHFGKWGMDSTPATLGYEHSDGKTKNQDGVFNNKYPGTQWRNNTSEDPKKIFSTTNKAINFIEKQAASATPFFIQVSHYAVHSDVFSLKSTLDKYAGKKKGKYQKHIGFAAMTEDLDTGVGKLLDRVTELGLDENTYIIYTSDNGAVPVMPPRVGFYKEGSNTPLRRGKWDAMEGGIRVPFILTGPNVEAGIISDVPINFTDILPTIIDLAGKKISYSNELDGGSFKSVLLNKGNGKVKRNSKNFIFHVPYENSIGLKRAHSAIIQDNFKLIKFYDNNQILLIDLNSDIQERNNLAIKLPDKAKKLEEELEDYLHDVKAPRWKPGINWRFKPIDKINSFH